MRIHQISSKEQNVTDHPQRTKPMCFVIQPFDNGGQYDKRYTDDIEPAIRAAGFEPYRVDHDPQTTVLIVWITQNIKSADACLVEISEDNPNVWLELGFAMAVGCPMVLICSDKRQTFPFDIQHHHIIRYKTESSSDLVQIRKEITNRLKAILDRKGERFGQSGKWAGEVTTTVNTETLRAQGRVDAPWQSKLLARTEISDIRYSFSRQEFVHPLIVRELLGWISDAYETIIGVDVTAANRSNRFFGDVKLITQDEKCRVEWRGAKQSFQYSHIATSPSGIEMVECYDWGGGSGIFGRVAFFCWERDLDYGDFIQGASKPRERILLKLLGSISLGDRYSGEINYREGFLVIGPDQGIFNRGEVTSRELPVE